MIAIIDYDAGNIRSVEKACRYLGEEPVITREASEIEKADHVILPGVGAFGDCMDHLRKYGLIDVIKDVTAKEIPFLGICQEVLVCAYIFLYLLGSQQAQGMRLIVERVVQL